MKLKLPRQIFEKFSISNIIKIRPVRVELFYEDRHTERWMDGRTDRQTDTETDRHRQTHWPEGANSRFRNFAKASKKHKKKILNCDKHSAGRKYRICTKHGP